MILLVNDASILIDLLKTDLIDGFFQLEYEFHVSDLAANEVQEEKAMHLDIFIRNNKLISQKLSSQELLEIQLLKLEHKALSVPDCSCLYLSEKLSATLLTGDAALRKTAQEKNIPVHGLLWVFDELVKNNLISHKTAFEKLTYILSINPRLPVEECKKRLSKWKKDR